MTLTLAWKSSPLFVKQPVTDEAEKKDTAIIIQIIMINFSASDIQSRRCDKIARANEWHTDKMKGARVKMKEAGEERARRAEYKDFADPIHAQLWRFFLPSLS